MPPYPNLISDSLLINETIALLRMFGGSATAVRIVDYVMNIRKPEPSIANKLLQDLIERDPRLRLVDDTVELVADSFETRGISDTDFVVFDLETTGAKAPPCRVTEIGASRVRNGRVVDQFHTLVDPEVPIPAFITMLTGISDQMVAGAPRFTEVAERFLEYVGDSVLVAHNSQFDMRFLNNEISLVYGEYRIGNPCLCTVQLSRKLLPQIANHKLKTLAEHYSVPLINHHRAADDARATAEIFINLLEMLAVSGVHDLDGIQRYGRTRGAYAG
jgi:DNA polymerase-3 subunit alpha (Gram-positive type)